MRTVLHREPTVSLPATFILHLTPGVPLLPHALYPPSVSVEYLACHIFVVFPQTRVCVGSGLPHDDCEG